MQMIIFEHGSVRTLPRLEFAHCRLGHRGHLRSVISVDLTFTSNHEFRVRTVSLGGGFELNGSFGIYVTMTDIPIIFECQVADS